MRKILVIIMFVMVSCGSVIKGPNYNQGRTHNADLGNRQRIVNAEDYRMKTTMIKTRKRASRGISKGNKKRHRRIRKIV
jgi:hypothetical protein